MSTGSTGIIKGIAGVAVVVLLAMTVANWWGDYKRAESRQPDKATTSTVEATRAATATDTASSTVVVLIDGLNFRKEPAPDAATIRGLKKGEKLLLVKKLDGWYQVKDSKGAVGFVSAKSQYVRIAK